MLATATPGNGAVHARADDATPMTFATLESLRGIAAMIVVLSHFPGWNPTVHGVQLIRNGPLMVDVFFVLSGFVIAHRYSGRILRWRDVGRFQWLRFGRLYPVHLLFVLAYLALDVAKHIATSQGMLAPNTPAFGANTAETLAANLALVQALGPAHWYSSFNAPAWSISVEFWCYLLFALSVFGARHRAPWLFAALAIVAAAGFAWPAPPLAASAIIRCIAGFFIGCLVAGSVRNTGWRSSGWMQAASLALLFAYAAAVAGGQSDRPLLYLLTAASIFLLATGRGGVVEQLLATRPLLALGRWSYAIYMSHVFFIFIAAQLAERLFDRPTRQIYGSPIPQFSLFETLAMQGATVAVILLFSAACFRFYERPLRDWSRAQVGLGATARVAVPDGAP